MRRASLSERPTRWYLALDEIEPSGYEQRPRLRLRGNNRPRHRPTSGGLAEQAPVADARSADRCWGRHPSRPGGCRACAPSRDREWSTRPILKFGATTGEGQRARRPSQGEHGGRGVPVVVDTGLASKRTSEIGDSVNVAKTRSWPLLLLLNAARHPEAHLSLLWFTIWSSVVHAAIMAMQSLANEHHAGHLLGDVPALILVAIVLSTHLLTSEGSLPPG